MYVNYVVFIPSLFIVIVGVNNKFEVRLGKLHDPPQHLCQRGGWKSPEICRIDENSESFQLYCRELDIGMLQLNIEKNSIDKKPLLIGKKSVVIYNNKSQCWQILKSGSGHVEPSAISHVHVRNLMAAVFYLDPRFAILYWNFPLRRQRKTDQKW